MAPFAHLRVHSSYSLAEGASPVEELVKEAARIGLPAMALTDRGNLYAALTYSKAASAAGVQPIIGLQATVVVGPVEGDVVLLAQNAAGYANLCALLRASHAAEGGRAASGNPAMDLDMLSQHTAGVILLTGGGADGLLPKLVAAAGDVAGDAFRALLAEFGNRLYVEICRSGVPNTIEAGIEDALIELANGAAGAVRCTDGVVRSEAPLVATSDVWYATPQRHDSWTLLGAVERKTSITFDNGALLAAGEPRHYLRSAEAMQALFADLPEAYDNACQVAQRCSFMVKGRKPTLPSFPCAPGRTEAEELREQARAGLDLRLAKAGLAPDAEQLRRERLEFELDVIERMGFPGYFLIVSDFIKWAKDRDIPVGPGRGSGAGSVVAWSLTITDLDPLEFGLLFERFLNPERVSMPDFDIDFCQDRRTEVRDYVRQKYGDERVALISTFGMIKSKTAVTDIQRIASDAQLGAIAFTEVKHLTKLIPKQEDSADPMRLAEAYEKAPEYRRAVDESPKLRLLHEQGQRIEGLIRSSGEHAAGLVIGDRQISDIVPVTVDAETGLQVAGFDMKGVESAGLVKFDFLGLTTLSVIHLTLQYIKEFRGEDLDIAAIPRDDAEVYARLSEGSTTGVFQFEGEGMRRVMRQIRPTCFEDLIAIVSLFRPGPMAYIDTYAARKAGQESIEYPQPAERTEPFLAETYGIMVYQEQVMQVAQACAGYSLGSADILRRAMGKKNPAEMALHRRVFIHGDPEATPPIPGAVALGMKADTADRLYDDIAAFAGYGFNKSHAAAYAWIGYQTAWLKTHYPAEYLSALMSYYLEKPDRLALCKDELDARGIPLLPPDVNHSHGRFRPEAAAGVAGGLAVRFGLAAIKRISGEGADLSAERAANGPFRSLEDMHRRLRGRFNKAQFERLAEAGALDDLAPSRRAAAEGITWLSEHKPPPPTKQVDLFGEAAAPQVPRKILDLKEWGDLAAREFVAVGFYYGNHPIDGHVPRLMAAGVRRRKSYFQYMLDNGLPQLANRKLCVMVDDFQVRVSRRGVTYVEANVSERMESYRIALFENRQDGTTVDHLTAVLQGAKSSRRPAVFLCSLAMSATHDEVGVTSRAVWSLDDFLAGVRGDIVITLDPTQLQPHPSQMAAVEEAEARFGAVSPQAVAARQTMQKDTARQLIYRLRDRLLEQGAAADAADGLGASEVRVTTPWGDAVLSGRYRVTAEMEADIRATSGVSSLKEILPESPQLAPRAAA